MYKRLKIKKVLKSCNDILIILITGIIWLKKMKFYISKTSL